jgi:hypothetical protein
MNLRETIFAAKDSKAEIVHVDEWGVDLEVRSMSGAARAEFLSRYTNEDGSVNWAALYPSLLIATCYDPESGERVFLDSDEDAINTKSGAALETVAQVSLKLSGMGNEKAVEEAGKR